MEFAVESPSSSSIRIREVETRIRSLKKATHRYSFPEKNRTTRLNGSSRVLYTNREEVPSLASTTKSRFTQGLSIWRTEGVLATCTAGLRLLICYYRLERAKIKWRKRLTADFGDNGDTCSSFIIH